MIWILAVCLLAVLGVLLAGALQFAAKRPDPRRSNRLMRLRVVAQAGALLVILGALALSTAG